MITKQKTNSMKEWISKYQKAIVGTGAVAVLVVCYFQQKELAKLRSEPKIEVYTGGDIEKGKMIDSLINLSDSLRAENLPLQIENGRNEVTLELLREKDKKAAELFELIKTTQTE
jgi:hypothetical protein